MRKRKQSKISMQRELTFLSGKTLWSEAEKARAGELLKSLAKPSKAEMREYRRTWIQWKRAMAKLKAAGLLDPDTNEPIFEKSV